MAKDKFITVSDVNKVLPEATAAKYEVISWPSKKNSTNVVFNKFGAVNFGTLTVARAAQLVKKGFPYLKLKTASK